MLGSTAGGLFWMFRQLERSENTARLLEAGLRMALTRPQVSDEWRSVLVTTGTSELFSQVHDEPDAETVVDFLLRDPSNPSSVMSTIDQARTNARAVRAALTREVWEATNESWISLKKVLAAPVDRRDLPQVLVQIRQESAYVRGALHGTMMRNDIYDFCRLGTFIERADNTARILDVKYHVLLPSTQPVGSRLDNVQWDNILRSISAQRAYRWRNPGEMTAHDIAEFVIFDSRMPRSLVFCFNKIYEKLDYLAHTYGQRHPCHERATEARDRLLGHDIASVFTMGLHEFLIECIQETATVARLIEADYRFTE